MLENCLKDVTRPTISSSVEDILFTSILLITDMVLFFNKFAAIIAPYSKRLANKNYKKLQHASILTIKMSQGFHEFAAKLLTTRNVLQMSY